MYKLSKEEMTRELFLTILVDDPQLKTYIIQDCIKNFTDKDYQEMMEEVNSQIKSRTLKFKQAGILYQDNQYQNAINILEELINPYLLTIYSLKDSFVFPNYFEQCIYYYNYPRKKYHLILEPLNEYLNLICMCYIHKKDYLTAMNYAKYSHQFSPYDNTALYQFTLCAFYRNDDYTFKKALKVTLNIAYKKSDLAKGYNLLGSWYERNNQPEMACLSYVLYSKYERNAEVKEHINELAINNHLEAKMNPQEIIDLFKQEGYNYGPSSMIISILIQQMELLKKNKDDLYYEVANIGYELTDDEYFYVQSEEEENE